MYQAVPPGSHSCLEKTERKGRMKKRKKLDYKDAEIELIYLLTADILTTSNGGASSEDDENWGENTPQNGWV